MSDARDRLAEMLDQAWDLTDAQIASISPGSAGLADLAQLVNPASLVAHPFTRAAGFELDRADWSLLKVLRNPEYFRFTAKNLLSINGVDPLEIPTFHAVALNELWWRQFPMLMCTRGWGKTSAFALLIILKCLFVQGTKIVVVGRALRQAVQVFNGVEALWYNSPILRDLVGGKRGKLGREPGPHRGMDRHEFTIGASVATFLPLGNGETIRGFRANTVLADEYGSIDEDIYSTVVQGFGAVASDPIGKIKNQARIRILKKLGMWSDEMDAAAHASSRGNQSIVAGTVSFSFNHFYRRWREYRDIIETRGDRAKLEEIFKGEIPAGFDHRAYSIIRVPFEQVPAGYMDPGTIARARASSALSIFRSEYQCIAIDDTEGFFKQTLINRATIGGSPAPDPEFPSCGPVDFTASLAGSPTRQYVYGVDPAMQKDNFAIVIIEVWPDHRRVVYCWTVSRQRHRNTLRQKTGEHDYWRYCTRKLRDLFRAFPPTEILIDSQGGGNSVREAFSDPDKLRPGELPVYEVRDPHKAKDTDDKAGQHLLRMVNFRDNAWTVEANWGLRKDMEERVLLFPRSDSLVCGLALEEDIATGKIEKKEGNIVVHDDSLEACIEEIELIKTELTTIIHEASAGGLERWDTPDKKNASHTKGRLRKDRYSAIVMANMGARKLAQLTPARPFEWSRGGFATGRAGKRSEEPMFVTGSARTAEKMAGAKGAYGVVVKRK